MNALDDSQIVIRASALTLWPDCERRAAARLFRSIIEARGFMLRTTAIHVAAPIGTAVHAGSAFGLQHKIDHGDLPSLDEARDVTMASLDEAIEEAGEIDWRPAAARNLNDAQKQARRMLAVVHMKLSPNILPAAVEDRLVVDIGDGFVLSGQRDVYGIEIRREIAGSYRPDDTGAWLINDLKTSAYPASHMPQTGAYALLARSHGNDVDGARILNIPRVPLSKSQPDPIIIDVPIESAERAAEATYKRAKSSLIAFLETGDPHVFMANPMSKLCNDSCPAWGTPFCREHLEID